MIASIAASMLVLTQGFYERYGLGKLTVSFATEGALTKRRVKSRMYGIITELVLMDEDGDVTIMSSMADFKGYVTIRTPKRVASACDP